jgi:osmotically-inducible protein OsmY
MKEYIKFQGKEKQGTVLLTEGQADLLNGQSKNTNISYVLAVDPKEELKKAEEAAEKLKAEKELDEQIKKEKAEKAAKAKAKREAKKAAEKQPLNKKNQ